jgi:hypothetical protein
MRHSRWLTAILALNLAGCVLRGKQQAKLPSVPPPPQPAARVQNTSAARPEPLSIPQTQAQLPPFQPVDPQALATVQTPAQPVETQPPKRPPRPTVGHVPAPAVTRPEPPAPAATAATQAITTPPPAPAESEVVRGQVQEILPPEELKHLQDSVAARKQEVRRVLDSASARKPNAQQAAAISRIQSFLQQSEDAEKRNDWRQADALGERAQILAREFQGGGR